MTRLLAAAAAGGYAVCYCEAWNLESFQAVVEAAEETCAPIIAGFNGGFLGRRARPENLAFYAGLRLALRGASVPAAFLLNETDDVAQIRQGIELGFNAVMAENEHLQLDDYRRLVKEVVNLAHPRGVSVEAQLGRLPDGAGTCAMEVTDPAEAADFVEATGIDALAVSIGNVHILTRGEAAIDLGVLERIRKRVRIPLVIHGGTGFPRDLARQAVELGAVKFNFGTALKQVYLAAVRNALGAYQEPANPHPFLGMGGERDILVAGRCAVKEAVKDLLRAYGAAGKAANS